VIVMTPACADTEMLLFGPQEKRTTGV